MIRFDQTDTILIDDFSLKWRWSDPTWNKLPAEDLQRILPVNTEKARELFNVSVKYFSNDSLDPSAIREVERFEVLRADAEEIRIWLKTRLVNATQNIVISWNIETAVVVSQDVFIKYWDDFCYPASDDVAIFPFDLGWMLGYSHEEYFDYGRIVA